MDQMKTLYSATLLGKSFSVLETFGKDGKIIFQLGEQRKEYRKFAPKINEKPAGYCGFSESELQSSGRDLAAENLISEGFDMEKVKGILPCEYSDGYIALGFYTSPRTFTVNEMGEIFFQPDFDKKLPGAPIFSPTEIGVCKDKKPRLSFANGIVPILFGLHETLEGFVETLYCVGHSDCDFEYGIWIRTVTVIGGEVKDITYGNVGNLGKRLPIDQTVFYEGLIGIFAHYDDIADGSCAISLPEKELERVYLCTLMVADAMMNGFQTKYGNMFYSLESHNHFPPNYIMAIQTLALCGQKKKARLLTEHFLTNCVDSFGRVIYRQGDSQLYGYSGSEVGQLFWVIRRAFSLHASSFLREYTDTLSKMADNILSFIKESDELPGVYLVRMCAEADTNGRIYDYLQNSLWTVRGLDALCDILCAFGIGCEKYESTSKLLRASLDKVCEAYKLKTKYGELVPFQLQYSPLPLTLSRCKDTAFDVSEPFFAAYMAGDTNPRNDISGEQNLLENNYANYRYYPEMLSSFMLDEKYADTIDSMRSQLGGELLCMTRFMNGLDDWPAYNNALYLLGSGRTEKYRLLMYSHILYHGLPDFGIYYEQAGAYGSKMRRHADSCLPSTLIPPFMLISAFCHVDADCKTVQFCRGVSDDWFSKGFEVHSIGVLGGSADIVCREGRLKITCSDLPAEIKKTVWIKGSAFVFDGACFEREI